MKPGIYWDGKSFAFGFWIVQHSGKMYFSGTPVVNGKWTVSELQSTETLHYFCSLEGEHEDVSR